ncbi:uncharacterized protein LOC110620334 [Manihot esculenta]|uniref:Uncharacterized protein n=1 Tax=Manihot esculenta TaxID=3983 RepID=A0A251KS07_MANES|nr:uncharacterized protein LOC110620334 [Manihot esculenta]XP_021619716.1 uncharacterized protein LOC110620334 [Manihot esculenta]XP_021619717.1 uncharacterized protein LOC110620334 [Manihot esculenta]XP_043814772.1 uncharacterized protein LOC110620334 [Manihot esculenta]OAY43134.1 hypothetical protein MANES_08G045200v8 [Manihot esculenta]OAY43135.1 hypothetical protein MANES_08G045200v8 [Manihot esculenta]OAY43136.1 hypothetical protein MANES_08G045200v8 [Manihot esculenta]
MGKYRGKGKKQTVIASHEDPANGEEKFPAYKRRGRPIKPLKDDNEVEEEVSKINEDEKDTKDPISSKDLKSQAAIENGRKRQRSEHTKENGDSVKEENGVGTELDTGISVSIGFRQNGSRRKNKPRRAAEAVVECK